MKRLFCLILTFLTLASFQAGVYASSSKGFSLSPGDFSASTVGFGFDPANAVQVYNKDLNAYPDYEEIWPGSTLYVPVVVLPAQTGQSSQVAAATDKDIKDNEVALSWIPLIGGEYVDSITLVDGKKEKIDGLATGIYAKIAINQDYTGRSLTSVQLKMVLSVKRMAYPETQVSLNMSLHNREIDINQNTVYSARSPTQFLAARGYNGYASFDFGDNIIYTSKVAAGRHYYMHLDRTVNNAIEELYPDAYMEYYNFMGDQKTFTATGELAIPISRANFTPKGSTKAQVFVYSVDGNELTSLDEEDLSFNASKNILTIRTDSLGNYILSDRPLPRIVDDTEEDVIYTGYEEASSASSSSSATSASAASSSSAGSSVPQQGSNPNTGKGIEAANGPAVNPLTSDPCGSLYTVMAACGASGFSSYVMWKKGWMKKKSDKTNRSNI